LQENPTTCPDCGAYSPEEIIAVGRHRACVRCGWRSQDFDKISFPTYLFLDIIEDLQHFGPFGSPEYHKQLDLRVRVQQFRARWPAAASKSGPAHLIEKSSPKAAAQISTDLPSPANRPKKRGRRRDVLLEFRRKIIREVSATGVTGPAYAKALDNQKLLPPQQWISNEGCPRSYPEAYRLTKWQHRINDEKSKYSE